MRVKISSVRVEGPEEQAATAIQRIPPKRYFINPRNRNGWDPMNSTKIRSSGKRIKVEGANRRVG
jgi:hypothetical protein